MSNFYDGAVTQCDICVHREITPANPAYFEWRLRHGDDRWVERFVQVERYRPHLQRLSKKSGGAYVFLRADVHAPFV
jgi:hypothetical protein